MRSERAGFAKPLPSLQDQGPHNQKQSALDYLTGPLLQQVGAQMSPQNSVPCGFWRSRMCGYPHNELWLCLNNLPKCFKSKLLTSDARDSLYFLFLWFLGPVLSGARAQRQGRKSQADLGVGEYGLSGPKIKQPMLHTESTPALGMPQKHRVREEELSRRNNAFLGKKKSCFRKQQTAPCKKGTPSPTQNCKVQCAGHTASKGDCQAS